MLRNLTLISLSLYTISLLSSCNNSTKIAVTEPVDSLAIQNPFLVEFDKNSPEYVKEQKVYLDTFYKKYFGDDFSGSFLVAKNGEVIYEKYSGYAYKEKGIEINQNTPIHVASVGKVITAAATLRLVDADKLKLDQTVKSILPTFPNDTTTVRMLLNHRSGLRNYAYVAEEKGVWDKKVALTNADVLDIFATNKNIQEVAPDRHFQYCNTNYVFLALIIEKITQKNFEEAIKDLILTPLKMKNTFVFSDLTKQDSVSQSYKSNYRRLAWEYLDQTYGDKNIFTTAQDLLKFDKATYSDNFLSKEIKEEMFKGYSYERKGTKNYGLGVRLLEFDNGKRYIFHTGWWHGNTAMYVTLRDENITLIAMSNKFTKKPYEVKRLAPHFNSEYPFDFKDDE